MRNFRVICGFLDGLKQLDALHKQPNAFVQNLICAARLKVLAHAEAAVSAQDEGALPGRPPAESGRQLAGKGWSLGLTLRRVNTTPLLTVIPPVHEEPYMALSYLYLR